MAEPTIRVAALDDISKYLTMNLEQATNALRAAGFNLGEGNLEHFLLFDRADGDQISIRSNTGIDRKANTKGFTVEDFKNFRNVAESYSGYNPPLIGIVQSYSGEADRIAIEILEHKDVGLNVERLEREPLE